WQDGSAIYYFVQQARLLHPFGVWLREQVPYTALQLLTHTTLVVEAAIAFLWLSPFFPKAARMFAWVLGVGLHLGIFAFATLGPFVWVMMIPYAMFIPRQFWEWASHRMRLRRQRLTVLLVSKSALSVAFGRIIKRLDGLELVRFGAAAREERRR